jgi:hypothetical protein
LSWIAGQWQIKNFSTAMNKQATIEEPLEAVFSVWSMPRLYNEDQLDKPENQLSVRGWSLWLAVLSCIVNSRYLANRKLYVM